MEEKSIEEKISTSISEQLATELFCDKRQKFLDEAYEKIYTELPMLIHKIILLKTSYRVDYKNILEESIQEIKKVVDAEIEGTSNYLKNLKS